jgi:hypothetical protein
MTLIEVTHENDIAHSAATQICFRDGKIESTRTEARGLDRTKFQHLFNEFCGAAKSVHPLDIFLQGLGCLTVPGFVKHQHDGFTKPGRA